MNNSIRNWYALCTKPGCEKKVVNLLSRKNIENFCPLKRQWNGRKKVVLEPLFNSYVFVQIDESQMELVRSTDSVVNFIYWLGKAAVIQNEEIEVMKRFMNEYTNIRLEQMPLDINGTVRVSNSTSAEKGPMVSVKNNTVKIILPSLGYVMLADLEKSGGEVLTPNEPYTSEGRKYQYSI